MALCHGVASFFATALRPAASATAPRPTSRSAAAPGQQHLPDGSSLQRPRPAVSSRWSSTAKPRPATSLIGTHGQQQTSSGGEKYSGLASNLAHLGQICELAAAAYDLSQHLLTYMCPSPLLARRAAAQTDANLSAHLHRLPTPPPYLRPMRLLPGLGRRYWVANDAAAWLRRRCWV